MGNKFVFENRLFKIQNNIFYNYGFIFYLSLLFKILQMPPFFILIDPF